MTLFVIAFPLLMAGAVALLPSERARPWLVALAGALHLAAVCALPSEGQSSLSTWLALDPAGKLILLIISSLFLCVSFYAIGYLRHRNDRSNRVFCVCELCFLGVAGLVACSRHFGLLWVAIETTTLVTAPLIFFNRTRESIEATWKYMLTCFVGIALALLGVFCFAYAAIREGLPSSLALSELLASAPALSRPWLRAGFVLQLVGYGTKMGLAPMHTWLPDAHGEAPSPASALLSGAVLPCAFLALARSYQVCVAAGEAVFAARQLVAMGLFSMAVAGLFMIGQRDIKRMLAYSSVEHMGILALGLGIGGAALFGTVLHAAANSLAKGLLFLAAGNIQLAYSSKRTEQVSGAIRRLPLSGGLFLFGFLAIVGTPPFLPFVSIFNILAGILSSGRNFIAAIFIMLLMLVFIGMGASVLQVTLGRPGPAARISRYRDTLLTGAPILGLAILILFLGVYIPKPLLTIIEGAAALLEGGL